ncbi:hypothetical protein A2643_01555 [Candidatus Nomurabacteria bacterium RIFCSPHIGHO2_01_FULL_39_220]|uniref:DUF4258 domain-containing protein n=1 Tax=Candidatus Nomurabacteria bacterium RIFCSPLOWO2_02_FULL_40_67 TaxID=1801787 RepID=A0A1F6Y599_9BACT|nr:MAG: hypothetical protein UU01_C0011G0009 [Parcubacteria group bacterium GW2011_GWA2_40_37]KKS12084.1 MAG: hypothetical protein UU66_C0002G0012 [Parcubacteria group bacterium GW2011_GWB1_41_5]KKS73049.1 MAG: hypothetical protein UV43_C0010G0007 [Parcubacteria group bacterium GW2011_GWF2_42_7]OGI61680.1 MAG: hypothetical protein A2W12_02290 [Candidatus Nomurabacteria bacterium RBG_16_40_11]OGI69943.1 MAG: hypothetical protein A2643_01555 [Candidatus Nomurabacteria bacterium RIFCSPHIGHO2_01_FU
MIIFTKHAQDKFTILRKHKFIISKEKVLETLNNPDLIDYSRLPLLIAQRKFDTMYVLRVVYKDEGMNMKVITFYPGRSKKYGKK